MLLIMLSNFWTPYLEVPFETIDLEMDKYYASSGWKRSMFEQKLNKVFLLMKQTIWLKQKYHNER